MNARMDNFRARIGGLAFGGDYNPEQWDRSVWREDVELMKAAGVNLVTLGVFAWSSLEPEPGRFTFEWMDEVFELLHANGIAIDLATPTMAPPVWLSQLHPETLPVMEDGEVFGFGNRLHYDPAAPAYRKHAAIITNELAKRYSEHPALAMWHISNEYGRTAYNDESAAAFRRWLQNRYSTIDRLNEAWYTRFWSQGYTSWDQVNPPEVPREWSNPARRLDFKRFVSDELLDCFIAERDIVRSYRDDIPVLTNFMRFYRHADYWKWAQEEDAAALDIYPNPGEADSRVAAALHFDLMRSLKNEPWLLMEQAASSVSQWKVNNIKRPGMMRIGSYQAIAHGADSVLYFQWRASRGGHERFHSAMLPHSGTDSRSWKEVAALGNELGRLSEIAGTGSSAEIAVLFDWNAWWGLADTHGLPRNDFDYGQLETDHYRPLLEAHHAVDFVSFDSDLSPYKVVIVPNAYLVSDRFVEELERFAAAGGTVVVSFFSGVVDDNNQVRQPAYPGAFRTLIGGYIDEYWPAREDETFTVARGATRSGAGFWQDSITLETAQALAAYDGGLLDGRPAIIENRLGDGRVVYLGTRLAPEGYRDLVLELVRDAGVEPLIVEGPVHVEMFERFSAEHRYLFALNHSEEESVLLSVPEGTDLISGEVSTGSFELGPTAVAVIRY